MTASIGIVLGSYSDVARMEPGLKRLQALGVGFEMCIASAHRTPERLVEWLASAPERGVRVIIAGAGAAAHLPGVVASKTLLPVIGVPFDATSLQGRDALYSIVQMPPGIPVATVGIDAAENAVILALQILAIGDPAIRGLLEKYREEWQEKIADQNEQLYAKYPEARPGAAAKVPFDESCACAKGTARIRRIDPISPDLNTVDEVLAILNPKAVAKLFALKGREPEKAIAVLVNSMKMFRTLAATPDDCVRALLDHFWPGPLTAVVRKSGRLLDATSLGDTIGVRMPDHLATLAVISMLERPLATTSANRSGGAPATSAQEVADVFGGEVDMILDAGVTPSRMVSTVVELVGPRYRILRQGSVAAAQLKEHLGDALDCA
jgi:5-(carboxyamino)imidazole ribonucleotide mutase